MSTKIELYWPRLGSSVTTREPRLKVQGDAFTIRLEWRDRGKPLLCCYRISGRLQTKLFELPVAEADVTPEGISVFLSSEAEEVLYGE